ncbi:MAG: FAD/NAD(P)-binding protein [Phycisphaeraceae bacterium]|nr:FAD/NAD(P)-binding protein [Phycisphaeraceae bacterium]
MIQRHMPNRAQRPSRRIAIIGGGFSGAAIALHLARLARDRTHLVMYEPARELGGGVAYGTTREELKLNVPAGKLTIFPDRPGDFHAWLHEQGMHAGVGDFLPRVVFGRYVRGRLEAALAHASEVVTLEHVHASVDGVRTGRDGVLVEPLGETPVAFDHAIIALGHGPSRVPGALQPYLHLGPILRSPWNEASMQQVAHKSRRVLLVGTGLTLCDAAIMLRRMGFQGSLLAVSRRGLLPHAHGPGDASAHASWAGQLTGASLRSIRKEVVRRARTHDWRGVVDALRPHTPGLWGSLGPWDRERFLRRLAPYWDIHRHRMDPLVHEEIRSMLESGLLRIRRGHVLAARPSGPGLECTIGVPGGGAKRTERFHADAVVLCTGPQADPGQWQSPLIDGLLARGLASLDQSGLGLRTDADGFLLGSGATVRPGLSTLGPLRRGELWESTAVPEIHVQAERLARRILEVVPIPCRHDWMVAW